MTRAHLIEAVELEGGQMALLHALPSGEPPTEIVLFQKGVNRTTKGEFTFDDQSARQVMTAFEDIGHDRLPFDAAHGMFNPFAPPEAHEALAWFKPQVREDGALLATDIEWDEETLSKLKRRRYRFYSPTFLHESNAPRRITRLMNVALTNVPATKGQRPLVASQIEPGRAPEKERNMDSLEVFLKSLGVTDAPTALSQFTELNSLRTGLLSLTGVKTPGEILGAVTALKEEAGKVPDLAKKLSDAELKLSVHDVDKLLDAAKAEGKVSDAELPKLREQGTKDVAWLSGYLAVKSKSAVATPEVRAPNNAGGTGSTELTAVDKEVCRLFAVKTEDFLKTRAAVENHNISSLWEVA